MISISYVSTAYLITVVLVIVALLNLAFFGWGYQGGRRSERGVLVRNQARISKARPALPPIPPLAPPVPPVLPYAAREKSAAKHEESGHGKR